MRRCAQLTTLGFLFAVIAASSGAGVAEDDIAFGPGSGRIWFSGCEFEADRYVVCKYAEKPVIEAISNPGTNTPGAALQAFMRTRFEAKGCSFAPPPESFRVNGIFLSFDSEAASDIRCGGQRSALSFGPGRMSLLDTVYFLADDRPPR